MSESTVAVEFLLFILSKAGYWKVDREETNGNSLRYIADSSS